MSRHPWLWAIALLYSPQLVPFAIGPLTECDHCIGSYLKLFVILPGFVVGLAAMGVATWFGHAVMGLVTTGILLLLRYVIGSRRSSEAAPFAYVLGVIVPIVSAWHAMAVAAMLRA